LRNVKDSYNGNYTGFQKTSLTSLEIGNQVTYIDNSMFNGCTGLSQIVSNAVTPPPLQSNSFYNVNKNIPVYVPCGSYSNYQTAQYWNEFTNLVDYCTEVVPAATSAVISWTSIEYAEYYKVAVYSDAAHTQEIGQYTVNSAGNIMHTHAANTRSASNELSLTVSGLSASTPYCFTITAYRDDDNEIVTFSGDFTTSTSSGSAVIDVNKLIIYPNPVRDDLFIKSETPIEKVEIYSLSGNLLLTNNFNEKISVSALPKGVFMVKVHTDNGAIVRKIVKE
jgi:hypothetical protein